eukprot:3558483-Ditylum_brightwellii.AAC.1
MGKEASQTDLVVLCSLCYLGRGLTFDDLEKYTVISEEVYCVFFTTRAYNLPYNHCHQILSSMLGHPSHWNGKMIVLFDDFVHAVKDGDLYNDFASLTEMESNGDTTTST